MSTLQRRSEQLFRSKGYLTASVEKRKRFPDPKSRKCQACGSVRMLDLAQDLWNVFDLIAIQLGNECDCGYFIPDMVFIQVTSVGNHATRRKKILSSAEARLCLLAGCRILIQSWRKEANRWQPRDEWITRDQFIEGLPNTAEEFYEAQRKSKLDNLPAGSTLTFDPDCAKDLPF